MNSVVRGEGGREDLIQKGMEFLQADSVRSHPMSERLAQLEKKGLSQHEVSETLRRLQASSGASASAATGMVLPAALTGVAGSWLWNSLIGAAMLGVGYIAYELSTGEEEYPETEPVAEQSALAVSSSGSTLGSPLQMAQQIDRQFPSADVDSSDELQLPPTDDSNSATYMLDADGDGDDQGSLTGGSYVNNSPVQDFGEGGGGGGGGGGRGRDIRNESAPNAIQQGELSFDSDIPGRLRKNIVDLNAAVDAAVETLASREEPAWAAAQSAERKDMARNIKIIKANLGVLDFGGDDDDSAVLNSKKITDFYQPDPSRRRGKKAYMRCLRKMKTSIQDMASANADATAGDISNGCKTMIMYLNNIVSNPSVPRYHRISTSNQTFKGTLAHLAGHDGVLQSAGFVKRGAYIEWIGNNTSAAGAAPRAETEGESLPATLTATAPAATATEASGNVFDDVSSAERVVLLKECIRLLNELQDRITSK